MKTRLAVLALAIPMSLGAQQPQSMDPAAGPVTNAFRAQLASFYRWLPQAFDSIPADKFSYKPTPAQQTVGYVAQHLASDNYFFCERISGTKPTRSEEETSTAADVKATWPKDKVDGGDRRPWTEQHDPQGRARHWGLRARSRFVRSLQPGRELHASERHAAAVGAAASASITLRRHPRDRRGLHDQRFAVVSVVSVVSVALVASVVMSSCLPLRQSSSHPRQCASSFRQ
jgi:hypothetical protein